MTRRIQPGVCIELLVLAVILGLNLWLLIQLGSLEAVRPDPKPGPLVLFGGIVGLIVVVLGVHELGHLIVGLAQGFELTIFVVGPLGIKKEDGKTKVYLNTNLLLAGGIAGTVPIIDDPANEDRFRRVVIAGPMASLVFSVICLWLAWPIENVPSFPARLFLVGAGILSFTIFLATTVPPTSGISFSDRKRYQRLMFPGKSRYVELATLRIMGSYQQHDSYRHVAVSDIQILMTADEPINRFLGHFNSLCHQVEVKSQIDPKAEEEYAAAANDVNPAIVKACDAELEKYKAKFLNL